MSNRPNLAITFLVTASVSVGVFWAISKFFQGTAPISGNLSESLAKNQGEVKLVGDIFSGDSTFRDRTFLGSLKGVGINVD